MEDAKNKALPGIGIPGPKSIELGKLVRETWVNWAKAQPDAKPSWLVGWDELDDGQKTVDILIGQAVAEFTDRGNIFPDLMGKQKIARLERQMSDQSTIIQALNRSVAQLMEHVRKYAEASKAVIDGYAEIGQAAVTVDGPRLTEAQKQQAVNIVRLHHVTLTKQAVDMGAYEAVDFTRLAADYIELREVARAIWSEWGKSESAGEFALAVKDTMERLKEKLDQYPTPDVMPVREIAHQVQVTTITITEHVRQLVAMLEPDARVEAVVYEKGKAAITEVSAKLAVLTQAVGEFLFNYPYQNVPHANPMHWYNKLCRTYDRLTKEFGPRDIGGDPVGYTTLKLKVLQVAAYYVLEAWKVEPKTAVGACDKERYLRSALQSLEAALDQTSEGRRTQEGKDLQA